MFDNIDQIVLGIRFIGWMPIGHRLHAVPIEELDRVITKPGIEFPEYDVDWQSEAYNTVGGQNSNNSVRVTDNFMDAAPKSNISPFLFHPLRSNFVIIKIIVKK